MDDKIREGRAAYLATDSDYDPLPDSAYESAPKDSDEHIVYELLKERRTGAVVTPATE